MLGGPDADQLVRSFFPLGDSTKPRSARRRRRGAASRASPTATTSASSPTATPAPGERRLGPSPETSSTRPRGGPRQHAGAHACTVGQRRGLGLDVGADGEPRYVLEVPDACQPGGHRHRRPARRRPRRGRPRAVVRPGADGAPCASAPRCGPTARRCRPRPRCWPPATTSRGADVGGADAGAGVSGASAATLRVRLDRRIRGVAPGQSVVLYEGTRVVGSATISGTCSVLTRGLERRIPRSSVREPSGGQGKRCAAGVKVPGSGGKVGDRGIVDESNYCWTGQPPPAGGWKSRRS